MGEALSAYLKQQERESRSRSLDWSRAVVTQLAKTGFDSRYGARPLQRAIETYVVTPLAQLLVNQTVLNGSQIGLRLSGSGLIVAELS